MPVIVNTNTQQNPMVAAGATGLQVVKFIDAPRIYIKAIDSTPTPIAVKSNGSIPAGYTDLGIVEGKAKITYTKALNEIRTGIDNVLRSVYVTKKTAKFDFGLAQFDDVVLGALSNVTPTITGTAPNLIAQYSIGSEDVVQKALLIVLQNKLDGKEWQFYHPDAYLSFQIQDNGDQTYIGGSADLPLFTFGGAQSIFVATMFE